MDMSDRSAIEHEIAVLKLAADVATEARKDELVSVVKRMLSNWSCNVPIEVSSYGDAKPTVEVKMLNTPYDSSIDIEFIKSSSCLGGMCVPVINCHGIYDVSMHDVENQTVAFARLKLASILLNALPELSKLVNSEQFMSYDNDIAEYDNAKRRLSKFDNDAFDERVQQVESSFKADQRLIDSCGHYHCIKRVTLKRLYMTNLNNNRKSLSKTDVARWIVRDSWKIAV